MNQHLFTSEEKIGDIVAVFPGASNLFKELLIDFCCGGDRTLAEAIDQRKLDEGEVLNRLNESYIEYTNREASKEIDWREASIVDLIDHIVNVHHEYLRNELPILSQFVTKIVRVHGGKEDLVLPALHKKFHEMKIELDQHLITEEEILFPLMRQYASNPTTELHEQVIKGLHVLETDHSSVGDALKEMRTMTGGYKLPSEACRTYTLTFQKLDELESDMFQHIHLENNILFPRIEGLIRESFNQF